MRLDPLTAHSDLVRSWFCHTREPSFALAFRALDGVDPGHKVVFEPLGHGEDSRFFVAKRLEWWFTFQDLDSSIEVVPLVAQVSFNSPGKIRVASLDLQLEMHLLLDALTHLIL
jgi:hypothetical protein